MSEVLLGSLGGPKGKRFSYERGTPVTSGGCPRGAGGEAGGVEP